MQVLQHEEVFYFSYLQTGQDRSASYYRDSCPHFEMAAVHRLSEREEHPGSRWLQEHHDTPPHVPTQVGRKPKCLSKKDKKGEPSELQKNGFPPPSFYLTYLLCAYLHILCKGCS